MSGSIDTVLLDTVVGEFVNLANAYTPTPAIDVVAVFDANYNQLFADARPIKASIKETAKLMQHPIENGATTTDFRVIEPIKIELSLILLPETYVATYNEIKQIFLGENTIQVQTNVGLYSNLMISQMPHDEDADFFDTITMKVFLEEVMFATTSTSPLPPTATTQNGGNKTGVTASKTQSDNADEKAKDSNSGNSAAYNLLYGTST